MSFQKRDHDDAQRLIERGDTDRHSLSDYDIQLLLVAIVKWETGEQQDRHHARRARCLIDEYRIYQRS